MFRLILLVTIGLSASAVGFIKVPDNWPGRIIGGQDAAPNQFPYQASLRTANNGHFCGGTIINNCYILSAAHCEPEAQSTIVVVGTIFLDDGGVFHDVVRVINHPEYDEVTLEHDLSLLKVSPFITYNAAVQPMPIGAHFVESGEAVVSGWGVSTDEGDVPNNLQFLNVTIISFEECNELRRSGIQVTNNTMCIFSPAGEGICSGDSGGPLIYNGGLHGVASWAPIPCSSPRPAGYVRVAPYVTWILTNAV